MALESQGAVAVPGHCHRARGRSPDTAGETAAGAKNLLTTAESNRGVFPILFGSLNATSFAGIGLIVVIKGVRGRLSPPGMGWERRGGVQVQISRGNTLQPYKSFPFPQTLPPRQLLSLPAPPRTGTSRRIGHNLGGFSSMENGD